MTYGIRKGLTDIAAELKGIRNVLSSMWQSKYQNSDVKVLHPEAFADEYISTEECAKRLNISDQTIRNWIAIGKKKPDKGWVEGLHYVNACPESGRKAIIRIPWNALVHSFAKNREIEQSDNRNNSKLMYKTRTADEVMKDGASI